MKAGADVVFSSARTGEKEQDCWQTPENVLDLVRQVAPIALDPCTSEENPTKADNYYTPGDGGDGLSSSPWATWAPGLVFINPPYSQMAAWAQKTADEVKRTGVKREYIALLPARTDTRWWHTLMATRPQRICFWKGRVKFNRPDGTPGQSAPFPSALLYWGADDATFARVFAPRGWITRT